MEKGTDLEGIKIYFIQRTVDIGRTVSHSCSHCRLTPVTNCTPNRAEFYLTVPLLIPELTEEYILQIWSTMMMSMRQEQIYVENSTRKQRHTIDSPERVKSHCFNLTPSHALALTTHIHTHTQHAQKGGRPNDVKSWKAPQNIRPRSRTRERQIHANKAIVLRVFHFFGGMITNTDEYCRTRSSRPPPRSA